MNGLFNMKVREATKKMIKNFTHCANYGGEADSSAEKMATLVTLSTPEIKKQMFSVGLSIKIKAFRLDHFYGQDPWMGSWTSSFNRLLGQFPWMDSLERVF